MDWCIVRTCLNCCREISEDFKECQYCGFILLNYDKEELWDDEGENDEVDN